MKQVTFSWWNGRLKWKVRLSEYLPKNQCYISMAIYCRINHQDQLPSYCSKTWLLLDLFFRIKVDPKLAGGCPIKTECSSAGQWWASLILSSPFFLATPSLESSQQTVATSLLSPYLPASHIPPRVASSCGINAYGCMFITLLLYLYFS